MGLKRNDKNNLQVVIENGAIGIGEICKKMFTDSPPSFQNKKYDRSSINLIFEAKFKFDIL